MARRPAVAWIETAILVLLVPAVGLWLHPADPLFTRSGFPWAVLAPLVAGLRYGFAPGFAAAAALAFASLGAARGIVPLHVPPGDLSPERTVGLLVCGMITGELSGIWRRRIDELEILGAHHRLRFDAFLRAHQALRLSHDQLESRLAGAPPSLREALRAVAELSGDEETQPAALGKRILDLFTTFAGVRQGAIFLTGAPDGPLPSEPAAHLGPLPDVTAPLIAEAIGRHESLGFESATAAAESAGGPGAVVLAVPLEDVEGRLWGLLAVTDLPFAAYSEETPARFAALAGHLADQLAFGAPGRVAEDGDEERAGAFARRLRRAAHDRRVHGLASGLVQFAVDSNQATALAETIARQRRATDQVLTARARDGRTTVTLLLPMTDDLGVARYLGRVEAAVREATGTSLPEAGIRVVEQTAIDLDSSTLNIFHDDDDTQPREAARR
jgi:hypothetical protein